MKKIFTIIAALILTVGIFAQDLAVSMKTDKLASGTITLLVVGGGTGTFSIDWGDGVLLPYTISGSPSSPTTITGTTLVDNAVIKLYVDGKYLTFLTCNSNELTELDVTNSSTLQYLRCATNNLTTLDITTNPNLAILECQTNQITSLDFTNSAKLWRIYCFSNKIANMTNFDNLVALKDFSARINPLSHNYNISGMTTLESFSVYNNNVTALDASGCTALTSISIHNEGPTYANDMDACALDALYSSLPDRTGKSAGNISVIYSTTNQLGNDVDGSDKTIATAKNWVIKSKAGQIYTGDGGGCISTANIAPTSTQFSLYPNPTKGLVQINIAGKKENRNLKVIDLTGKVMFEKVITDNATTLNTSNFPKGLYFISTGKSVQKLTVQ